jgi:hypothetical protein
VRRSILLLTIFVPTLLYGQAGSLVLSSGAAATNGTVSLAVNLTAPAGSQPATLAWTFTYPSGNVLAISAVATPLAGKALSCAPGSGRYSCLLSAQNMGIIPDGIVAVVNLTMAPTSVLTSIGITAVSAASPSGSSVGIAGAGGAVSGPSNPAPALTSLACTPPTLAPSGSTTCTVSLTGPAPSGGSVISLSSSNTLLPVPASVTVSAGATTASFTATAAASIPSNQFATITATFAGQSKTASLSLVAPPVLSSLACNPTSLNPGGASSCTVALSKLAPSGGSVITLSSSNTLLTVPTSITVSAGATTATFTATAGGSTAAGTISFSQGASITATLNGGSRSQTFTLNPLFSGVASLTCAPTIVSGSTGQCAVVLTTSPSSATAVSLSTTNAILQAPLSVAVSAGSLSAAFPVTAGAVTANQTVAVTATLNGVFATSTLTVQPPSSMAAFSLRGVGSELSSLQNGATVTPTAAPSGLSAKVVVRGAGSVTYAPLANGDGLAFNGTTNANTAFLAFSGAPIGSLFNSAQGDLTFSLQSKYSFSERKTATPSEVIFQVDDGTRWLCYFLISGSASNLVFYVGVSGAGGYYVLPAGQEDMLFGKNVAVKIRITWNGSRAVLYVNDVSRLSFAYTPVASTWGANSSFTIGATSLNYGGFGGGYYPSPDAIADFEIK